MNLRIGYGGIGVESSSFTPLVVTRETFRIARDKELLSDWIANPAQEMGVELVPLMLASSTPNGHVRRDDWEQLKEEFLGRLRESLPLDGLLLRAHGATIVGDAESGELDLLRAIRNTVGNNFPIGWSADLHGNVPPELGELATFITAYRTAPHRDAMETVIRALQLLASCVRSGKTLYQSVIRVPVLLPGEKVITEVEPGFGLYNQIPRLISQRGLFDCSIFVGFGWADVPHAGASVVAVSERSKEEAREAAEFLAQEYWKRRHDFRFEGEALGVDESIQAASISSANVFISDSGDNISAGAPGDSVVMLESLLRQNVQNALFAPLVDGPAVEACVAAGEGSRVSLEVGGTLSSGAPIAIEGVVRKILHRTHDTVVALIIAGVEVVLLSHRGYFHEPSEYQELGIDLLSKHVVVIKLGYLFPELRKIAPRSILSLSPGPSGLVLEEFTYRRLSRPIFPFDGDFEIKGWQ